MSLFGNIIADLMLLKVVTDVITDAVVAKTQQSQPAPAPVVDTSPKKSLLCDFSDEAKVIFKARFPEAYKDL